MNQTAQLKIIWTKNPKLLKMYFNLFNSDKCSALGLNNNIIHLATV